jgi:hypothetical protein
MAAVCEVLDVPGQISGDYPAFPPTRLRRLPYGQLESVNGSALKNGAPK